MTFQGQEFHNLTPEGLAHAEAYTADAIAKTEAHLAVLRAAYEEIGIEVERRNSPLN